MLENLMTEKSGDAFWKKKLSQIAAERVGFGYMDHTGCHQLLL
jgi:hypothetical protein